MRRQGRKLRAGALAADAPAAEEDEAITEARRVADLVDGEEERASAGGVHAQCCRDIAGLAQVETLERLVDQQGGLGREQSDAEQGALALAFGKGADRLSQQLAKIELRYDFLAKIRATA